MLEGIYPQSIQGRFRSIKNRVSFALLFFYFCVPFLRYSRGEGEVNQAIMVDLPARKGYLFGIEIWPNEMQYLAGMLILSALGLFIVTSLYGRVWCGFSCPQTVFTDIFIKIESFFQGNRNARMKLDESQWDSNKIRRKLATHISWVLVSICFATGWVAYFSDAFSLWGDLFTLQLSGSALAWVIALTLSTYFFAGFMRERVCTYICPYGRFQSAMLDSDTLVVSYSEQRGEPRAPLNMQDENTGSCIDCSKCVLVCPMGIDIRDGLQMECIGCGLCVDACNSVMQKLGKPIDYLIGFTSLNSSKSSAGKKAKLFSPKLALYGIIFIFVTCLLLYSLINKSEYEVYFSRNRMSLYTQLPDGGIRNNYKLRVINKSSKAKKLYIKLNQPEGAKFLIQRVTPGYSSEAIILLPESGLHTNVFVSMLKPDKKLAKKYQKVLLSIKEYGSEKVITKELDFTFEKLAKR